MKLNMEKYKLFGSQSNITHWLTIEADGKENETMGLILGIVNAQMAMEVSSRITLRKFNSVQHCKRIWTRSMMKQSHFQKKKKKNLSLNALLGNNDYWGLKCVTPNPCFEALTGHVVVFGGGDFGR